MGGRSLCSAPAECPRATSWTTASSWGECPQWGGVGPCAWVPPAAGGCCPSCPGSTKPATSLEASPLLLRGLFHLIYSSLAAQGLHCCTGFSLFASSAGSSGGGAGAPHCSSFCCGRAQARGCPGSRSGSTWARELRSWALEHRLSSGAQA